MSDHDIERDIHVPMEPKRVRNATITIHPDQLPDGVERVRRTPVTGSIALIPKGESDGHPVTVVEGHGRVREMYAVVRETGDVVSVWNTATDAQNASFFCSMPVTIRRCIVIEMDNAATPQE